MPLDRLAALLSPDRADRMAHAAERARAVLGDRTMWHVNSTATGGGVAEMLQALLAYALGAGVDTRWEVLEGTPDFFRITKRLHNRLHGDVGDGGELGPDERALYEEVLAENLEVLREQVRPGDIVLLHDPQTAGLLLGLRELGAHVVWRCHVGRDEQNEVSESGWEFLKPYLTDAEAFVFSRRVYAPAWVPDDRLWVIPPSLDPFTAKNTWLEPSKVTTALRHTGLVAFPHDDGDLHFVRRDGSTGQVRRHTDLMQAGGPIPPDAKLVLQVSRWDRLKDMAGVLQGFAAHLHRFPPDTHLALIGPAVAGVADDPEGAEVLAECINLWWDQPDEVKERIHLGCLPMDDVDENAHLVNALQHHASVVVQKSIIEGFGLTVTEPMWKGKPVLASRVGGIQDQIEHGVSGVLLDDPRDLDEFGSRLFGLLDDPEYAERLGAAARERVRDRFLGDRHLIQYVDLFETLLT